MLPASLPFAQVPAREVTVNEFVLNGLVKRRAQLAGDIENTHEALRKMVLDLESLDATTLQFDPGLSG